MPTKRKTTKKKGAGKATKKAATVVAYSITGTGKSKTVRAKNITQALHSISASLRKKGGRATIRKIKVAKPKK